MVDVAVPILAPELTSGSVGHLALEDGLERVGIDGTGEPERLGALAGPGAGVPVVGVVPRVVAVALVVGDALGGRGDGAD